RAVDDAEQQAPCPIVALGAKREADAERHAPSGGYGVSEPFFRNLSRKRTNIPLVTIADDS
ncbi:MAG: hypothetical protein JWL72_4338, partial [Ilumatobacteraceae bacterium]|nr:hypothetical protein [Ilumatobacteraceae bacterium]